jgi:hypothetical protein
LWCKKIQNNKKISDENNVEEKSYPYLIFNKKKLLFLQIELKKSIVKQNIEPT